MSVFLPPVHLAVALDGAGRHPAAWREPSARPRDLFTRRILDRCRHRGRTRPARLRDLRGRARAPVLAPHEAGPAYRPGAREAGRGARRLPGRAADPAHRYGPWVRSIHTGEGAIEFPAPEQARAHPWSDEDRALVADRVETQFVGSPRRVADQLEQLQQATGADELIITTITHHHADRVRSYELPAEEWRRR